jgi:hypothetical protein
LNGHVGRLGTVREGDAMASSVRVYTATDLDRAALGGWPAPRDTDRLVDPYEISATCHLRAGLRAYYSFERQALLLRCAMCGDEVCAIAVSLVAPDVLAKAGDGE